MARPDSDRHPGIATHSVDHTGRAQRKAKHHRASRKAAKLAAKKLASQGHRRLHKGSHETTPQFAMKNRGGNMERQYNAQRFRPLANGRHAGTIPVGVIVYVQDGVRFYGCNVNHTDQSCATLTINLALVLGKPR